LQTAWTEEQQRSNVVEYNFRPGRGEVSADASTALRHGLRLRLHCAKCNVGLMAILLGLGVMDLRAMAVVARG